MMKKLALISLLFGILGIGVYGQTIKSLGYNTTNGQVVYSGTNTLNFTNTVQISSGQVLTPSGTTNFVGIGVGSTNTGLASGGFIQANLGLVDNAKLMAVIDDVTGFNFYGPLKFWSDVEQTRTNLGLGATWLTNTNVTNFRTAIGLGATNDVVFDEVQAVSFLVQDETNSQIVFEGNSAAITRTNLGLGGGITTNRTFVAYDGTNYTTNSVTISNGIITGWTQ